MSFEYALKQAAYKVWEELEYIDNTSDQTIFPIREEGLTTMALKALQKANDPKIRRFEMVGAKTERVHGYDFELAIGSSVKTRFVRFFIQSKKLNGSLISNQYPGLKIDQANKVIAFATEQKSIPLYALYNSLTEHNSVLENHYNSVTTYDRKALGITLTSAHNILVNKLSSFKQFHFNNGDRVNPIDFEHRSFPHLFNFYKHHKNLAVPFHELAYLNLDIVDSINRAYKQKQNEETLSLLLLLLSLGSLGNDNLIPTVNLSPLELENEFLQRASGENTGNSGFTPKELIIIDEDKQTKK